MSDEYEGVADARLAVIGLGYVGLPLAVEFARQFPVVAFDIDPVRVGDLARGDDRTREVTAEDLHGVAQRLTLTADPADLAYANTYIVTVPTPIDGYKRPDLGPLLAASRTVGAMLAPGDVVIYESTVYPGATEEDCVPVLEEVSGLAYNRDFTVGYSPERVNPGDPVHRIPDIVKVTAGSAAETAAYVDALYQRIIRVGTHPAPSIRVAEAAKVIENTQRDVNIALVNELAMLFHQLDLDTEAVLKAAGTKWNFLPFRPGLVGGHCIGIDPYYLTQKAQAIGFHPEMILAGRRTNDRMGEYIAARVLRLMSRHGIPTPNSRILVAGATFKENTPDLRNSQTGRIVAELLGYYASVDVYDPWVDSEQMEREFGAPAIAVPEPGAYDAVILAVAHRELRDLGAPGLRDWLKTPGVLFDVKSVLAVSDSDERL